MLQVQLAYGMYIMKRLKRFHRQILKQIMYFPI